VFIKEARKNLLVLVVKNRAILLISSVALLENVIMKQHAVLYSFDRMKGVIVLLYVLLCCVAAVQSMRNTWIGQGIKICAVFVLSIMACLNLKTYIGNGHYIQNAPYLANNRLFAQKINAKYTHENSILGQDANVRGYTNLLFGRGIYERTSLNSLIKISADRQKRYTILLQSKPMPWNMYEYGDYIVYDVIHDRYGEIDGQLYDDENTYFVIPSNFTDINWIDGVMDNILIFENTPQNSKNLGKFSNPVLTVEGVAAEVRSIEVLEDWIWVTVDTHYLARALAKAKVIKVTE
jgi:hypothetical protein